MKIKLKFSKFYIRLIIIFVFLLVIVCLFFLKNYNYFQPDTITHFVTLKTDGFFPGLTMIHLGDTVRFSATTQMDFWPASDDHPKHAIYPKFDSNRPIPPNQSWDFTFNKLGNWGYHDHLLPQNTGTIVVVGKSENLLPNTFICNESNKKLPDCQKQLLKSILKTGGLQAGFDFFNNYTLKDSNNCHKLAHEFGKMALEEYLKFEILPMNQDTSFCEFGFWHGMIAASVKMYGNTNVQHLKNICDEVGKNTSTLDKDIPMNCWHGLGLAAITDPPPVNTWGNFRLMAESAFPFCEKVSTTDNELLYCISGVFHTVIDYMLENQYKLTFDKTNPLLLCQSQQTYLSECYYQLGPKIADTIHLILIKNPNYLDILTEVHQEIFVKNSSMALFRNALRRPNVLDEFIDYCRLFKISLQNKCFEGGIHGLKFDNINTDDIASDLQVQFCKSKRFTSEEKIMCTKFIKESYKNKKQ